jgi:membrane-associated phospholipid phosphatase
VSETTADAEKPIHGLIPRDGTPLERAVAIFGIVSFVVGSAIWIALKGLFIQTDTVVLWVLAGLFALTLTDLRRWGLQLFWDWLPLGALLIFYTQSGPLAKWLHIGLHTMLQVHFDEFIFGKPLLTVQLQHLFHQTRAVHWWEYPMWAIYMTHFFMALVVAGILWRFSYQRFREFRAPLIVLSTLGFATYVLYPAAPPWMLADTFHQLPLIHRTVFETWTKVGLHTAGSITDGIIDGNSIGNQTAAVPSMHAAISLFVASFFWRGARWWLRVVLVLFVLGMAFTLVYSGEHYFFDVVVGWLYTVVVVGGFAIWRRRKASMPGSTSLDEAPEASSGELVGPAERSPAAAH